MNRAEQRKKIAAEKKFLAEKLEENRFDNLMLNELSIKLSRQNELLLSIKNNVQFFFWIWLIGMVAWFFIAIV